MALTDDDRTLIVAEPGASRLTRFSVAADGSLSDREVFAELTPAAGLQYAPPDGICLDADGAVWAAEPIGRRVLRIEPGGRVTDEMPFTDGIPVACVLGGDDRRTLFICVGATLDHDAPRDNPQSRIDAFTVDTPGAGRP
jgi:sugar lactone lactonase YvrE